jgi:hypothetical protein
MHASDAGEDAAEVRSDAVGDAGEKSRRPGTFDSERAREAALRRHRGRSETKTDATTAVVRDPRLVEDALWRKAQAGDVAAARELRAWREGEESSDVDPWKTISREEREQLLDALRAERTHPPAA